MPTRPAQSRPAASRAARIVRVGGRSISGVASLVLLATVLTGADINETSAELPQATDLAAVSDQSALPMTDLTWRTQQAALVSRDADRDELGGDEAAALQAEATQAAAARDAALAEARAQAEARAAELRERLWVMPLQSYERISARFGASSRLWSSTHTGLDLAAGSGTPVYSAGAGTVTAAGYDGAYGNRVVVLHSDGTETWYGHLSRISASPGDVVNPGDVIGAVGSTGNSTGPHLHFEVRPGGQCCVDPYAVLVERGALV